MADPQYSSSSLRDAALEREVAPVITYPRNQKRGIKGTLRIDGKFRSHGPEKLRRAYRNRVSVEHASSAGSRNLAGLAQHNLKGLAKITVHVQLCIITILFTAQAAANTHKPGKTRSIRYFAN